MKRQWKVLLLMPVVIGVFLCGLFFLMSGGKGEEMQKAVSGGGKGFNPDWPGAKVDPKDSATDKMGFYYKADQDSIRRKDEFRRDPYMGGDSVHLAAVGSGTIARSVREASEMRLATGSSGDGMKIMVNRRTDHDVLADRMLERLKGLQRSLDRTGNGVQEDRFRRLDPMGNPGRGRASEGEESGMSVGDHLSLRGEEQTAALEASMRLKGMETAADNPQLDKWNAMLDKIVRIRHPEVSTDTTQAGSLAYELLPSVADGSRSEPSSSEVGFYEIREGGDTVVPSRPNVVAAVVNDDQVLLSGGTIGLRLTEETNMNGVVLPRNTLLSGVVSIAGERLGVTVNSVRVGQVLYPLSLAVYDQDGLPGIRIPDALQREVAKQSADQAVSTLGATASLDPSLGAQAANAGIQAARTLFSKKVRTVRVTVKAGYAVFLKNTKNRGL